MTVARSLHYGDPEPAKYGLSSQHGNLYNTLLRIHSIFHFNFRYHTLGSAKLMT